MALRVEVEPELLHWAIERSGVGSLALHRRFPKLAAWLEGSAKPTYKQTEAFAQATYTPLVSISSQAPRRNGSDSRFSHFGQRFIVTSPLDSAKRKFAGYNLQLPTAPALVSGISA